ncbi:beta/alpha barrel domain-containing protein [Amycolatopsis alkalitolerans]|uniref:Citramalate synthase n=1 Tax=Amycolatopsis alkalitolerans TaxID=2547244 RepID=A0A5C4MAW3_9PSEU|nr:citramalate synthase [Amycolatopsis alkalitolerans]TNC29440.1 citramalate synthase [Amycolatopsis alkalitolerans]
MPGAAIGPPGWPAVAVVDEGPREGLQIEDAGIPAAEKVRLIDAMSAAGLRRIVVGSFVSPKWTPQMAEVEEVVKGFTPRAGTIYTALALNQKGVERRAQYLGKLSLDGALPATLVHLCDVFVRRNTNRSQEDEIAAWELAVARAKVAGATEAQVGVNAAWGSNWLGLFTQEQRMTMLERQIALWTDAGIRVTKVFLGDPMGWHTPDQVEGDLTEITQRWPAIRTFHLHLHNTRGMAPISAYSALKLLDARHTVVLDASIGGMGGCPYCGNGRAAGLFPTEDLIYLLHALGYDTGVDLDALIEAAIDAEDVVGHRLYGHVSKAGGRPGPDQLYPMDMPFVETLEQAQHFRLGPSVYAGAPSPWKRPIVNPARPS